MALGYLGPEGSFSHEAALRYSEKSVLKPMSNFYEIVEAVDRGAIEEGILPLENSTEGVVASVTDALYDSEVAYIRQELIIPVIHNLYSIDGDKTAVRCIYSHFQAIEQCRRNLFCNFPSIALVSCESTSKACEIVRQKGKGYGAIANSSAAQRNDLNTVMQNLNDNQKNKTRFVVIGRERTKSTGKDKTSIAFTCNSDGPGSLYKVLGEFAKEKVNLTRIESRPAKDELGLYVFFIDFLGHSEDSVVAGVLDRVRKMTQTVKIMGSYPACI